MTQDSRYKSIEANGCSIIEVLTGEPTIYRVGLSGVMPGFREFITPWVITEKASGRSIVVDPGPADTIPQFVKVLEGPGVEDVQYVLLTHAHIDQQPTDHTLEEAACRLLREDRLLSQFSLFDDEVRGREQSFIENAIRGFVGYLLTAEERAR